MSIVPRNILKPFFATGKKPNQLQFYALLDSYVHILDDRDLLGLKPYNQNLVYKTGDTVVRNKTIYQASMQTTGVFDPAAWVKIAGGTEGGLFFKGAWDASTNTPNLNTVTKTQGDYYVVSVAGNTNLDGITDWNVGDWAIYNGTVWQKIDNTDGVTDAQNLGNDGYGVFKTKTGTILDFRKLSADNGSITIIPDANDEHLDFSIKFDDTVTAIDRVWSSQKTSDELDEKIDVVNGAVQNNFPAFNASGELIDSGYDATDFLPSSTRADDVPIDPITGITGTNVQAALEDLQSDKLEKVIGVANNFPYFDGTGSFYNSGYNFNSFLPSTTQAVNIPIAPISGITSTEVQGALSEIQSAKIAKVTGAEDELPVFTANGSLISSGFTPTDFLPSTAGASDIPIAPISGITATNVQGALAQLQANKITTVSGANSKIPLFNAAGMLVSSGLGTSDFLPANTKAVNIPITTIPGINATEVQGALQDLQTDKMEKTTGVANNFPYFDGQGGIYNSGYNFSSFLSSSTNASGIPITPISGITATQVQGALAELQTNKIGKVTNATDKLPLFNAAGMLVSSGLGTADFLPASTQAINIPVTPSGNVNGNVQASLVAIDGIATTSQSGLSTHVANLNNPHQVTKTQVGLSNVTNDKQLSAKHYAEVASFGPSTSSSAVVVLTTPVQLSAGSYYLDWYMEFTGSANSVTMDAEVFSAGTSVGKGQFKVNTAGDYNTISGFARLLDLTAGTKTFEIKAFKSAGGVSSTFSLRNMRVRVILI